MLSVRRIAKHALGGVSSTCDEKGGWRQPPFFVARAGDCARPPWTGRFLQTYMTESIDTTATGPARRVREALDDVLAGSEVFPVDVVVRGRSGSIVVDVFVDSAGPIGSDDLASISRQLGRVMEEEEVIRGAYRLNVSTPGLDRPLRDSRQYAKHVGRPVEVLLVHGDDDQPVSMVGTLAGVIDDAVVLRTVDGTEQRLSITSIAEAKVQLPW